MSHSWSPWLGEVLEAPDPVQAYFYYNNTWALDCVNDESHAMPISCAYDCANITAITSTLDAFNTLWQCMFYPNVTNEFRLGVLSQAQESALSKAHVDTSLARAATVTSTISTCLSAFCENLEGCKQLRPLACSSASLTINGTMFNTNTTDACIQAICANHPEPLTNTDIAGIGVVLSYIIQFALALLGASALVALKYFWKADSGYIGVPHGRHVHGAALSQDRSQNYDSEVQVKHHPEAEANIAQGQPVQRSSKFEQAPEIYQEMSRAPKVFSAIVAALVEFLKAQCFVAIAVCIAALIVLNSQPQTSLIDAVAIGAAGGISVIPITFNYYVLASFNTDPQDPTRKSWYLYSLCLCSWALGLSVVLSPQMFGANEENRNPSTSSNIIYGSQYPNACGNASPLSICPQSSPPFVHPEFTFYYTLCVPVMVGLTVWQLSTVPPVYKFLSAILRKSSRANLPLFAILHLAALGLFVAPVAFFFDSLSDLFRADNVSFDWSFGQILAMTLWIPSVAGLVNNLWDGVGNAHEKQMPIRYSVRRRY